MLTGNLGDGIVALIVTKLPKSEFSRLLFRPVRMGQMGHWQMREQDSPPRSRRDQSEGRGRALGRYSSLSWDKVKARTASNSNCNNGNDVGVCAPEGVQVVRFCAQSSS
jgi:hypothetical protein